MLAASFKPFKTMKQEHFEKGHLNIYTKDQDSFVTGYGKHARVVAFIPDTEGLYCRIDYVWGLSVPSEKEILKVAKHYGDARGSWKLKSWKEYENSGTKRADVYFSKN
jgi:hypothetical protein